MSTRMIPQRGWLVALVPAALLCLLAGCGSTASAANGTITTACPTPGNFKTVSGTIASLSASGATVTTTSGASATVLFSATTRFSKLVAVNPATLTSGATVQVIVKQGSTSAVIPAQIVLVQSGQGFTNGGPRQGGGRSFNPACRNRGQGQGQGLTGLRGVRGTITAVNASQQQITVTDQQGNSFVFALNGATVASTTRASASDLAVGDAITASGQQTANGLQALTVQDLQGAK